MEAEGRPPVMAETGPPREPFDSTLHLHDNKFHILLCASGSVATIKIPNIARCLHERLGGRVSIRIILTSSAAHFLQGQSSEQPSLAEISRYPSVDGIYLDTDEWVKPWVRGDKILHIELRRWADVMLVAPLSANTLAKMLAGLCDNLLLATMRAWDTTGLLDVPRTIPLDAGRRVTYPSRERRKLIVLAPAMNTAMWVHPITGQQLGILDGWEWVEIMRPVEKELACGDVGGGAMCNWEVIAERIEKLLLTGK